jgi:hypothetical protein
MNFVRPNKTPNDFHPNLLRLSLALAAAAILPAFFGCTSLRTSKEPVGGPSYASGTKARVGLYYFLPKALLTIEGTQPKEGAFVIAITKRMVADRRHRYHLRWTQNPFYDDKVTATNGIAATTEGLLTTVDMSTTDQTPAIVSDLAATTINVFKILGGGGAPGRGGPGGAALKPLHPFRYTFDPLDSFECNEVRNALEGFGIIVRIDVLPSLMSNTVTNAIVSASKDVTSEVSARNSTSQSSHSGTDTPRSGGVFFHPPTTVEIRLDLREAGADLIHRETLLVPDQDRVACFRFGRSPFVKRDTTLILTDGVPTAFKIDRPSTVKALTGTISTLSSTIANAVPTIANVRVSHEESELNAKKNLLTAQAAVLEQQKKVLDDRKALLESEKALEAAKKQAAAAPTPTPSPAAEN